MLNDQDVYLFSFLGRQCPPQCIYLLILHKNERVTDMDYNRVFVDAGGNRACCGCTGSSQYQMEQTTTCPQSMNQDGINVPHGLFTCALQGPPPPHIAWDGSTCMIGGGGDEVKSMDNTNDMIKDMHIDSMPNANTLCGDVGGTWEDKKKKCTGNTSSVDAETCRKAATAWCSTLDTYTGTQCSCGPPSQPPQPQEIYPSPQQRFPPQQFPPQQFPPQKIREIPSRPLPPLAPVNNGVVVPSGQFACGNRIGHVQWDGSTCTGKTTGNASLVKKMDGLAKSARDYTACNKAAEEFCGALGKHGPCTCKSP